MLALAARPIAFLLWRRGDGGLRSLLAVFAFGSELLDPLAARGLLILAVLDRVRAGRRHFSYPRRLLRISDSDSRSVIEKFGGVSVPPEARMWQRYLGWSRMSSSGSFPRPSSQSRSRASAPST